MIEYWDLYDKNRNKLNKIAKREVKEELDFDINETSAKFIGSTLRYYPECPDILDVWLFNYNIDIDKVKVKIEEVNDVMWASKEKILELYKNGKFEANAFLKEAIK